MKGSHDVPKQYVKTLTKMTAVTICRSRTEVPEALTVSDVVIVEEIDVIGAAAKRSMKVCWVIVKDPVNALAISSEVSWTNWKDRAACLNAAAYFFVQYGKDEVIELLQVFLSEVELKDIKGNDAVT